MEVSRREFTTVRSIYLILYGVIWCMALLIIVFAITALFTDTLEGTPFDQSFSAVLALSAFSVVVALVLSWLVLITICLIDSRNFLANIYTLQLEQADKLRGSRYPADKYERNI